VVLVEEEARQLEADQIEKKSRNAYWTTVEKNKLDKIQLVFEIGFKSVKSKQDFG
jgi:hypothetical protein